MRVADSASRVAAQTAAPPTNRSAMVIHRRMAEDAHRAKCSAKVLELSRGTPGSLPTSAMTKPVFCSTCYEPQRAANRSGDGRHDGRGRHRFASQIKSQIRRFPR